MARARAAGAPSAYVEISCPCRRQRGGQAAARRRDAEARRVGTEVGTSAHLHPGKRLRPVEVLLQPADIERLDVRLGRARRALERPGRAPQPVDAVVEERQRSRAGELRARPGVVQERRDRLGVSDRIVDVRELLALGAARQLRMGGLEAGSEWARVARSWEGERRDRAGVRRARGPERLHASLVAVRAPPDGRAVGCPEDAPGPRRRDCGERRRHDRPRRRATFAFAFLRTSSAADRPGPGARRLRISDRIVAVRELLDLGAAR